MNRIAKRAAVMATLCFSVGLGTAGMARAQGSVDRDADKPLAIKVGVYAPFGREVRRAAGSTLFCAEGSYILQRIPEGNSVTRLNIGYIKGNSDRFYMVPVTISQEFRDPGNSSGNNYHYGFGLGLYPAHLNTPATSNRNKAPFGGFINAGIEGPGAFFAEVKYHVIARFDRQNLGGFQATIGYRL